MQGQYEVGQQALLDSGLFKLLCESVTALDEAVADGSTLVWEEEDASIDTTSEPAEPLSNGVKVLQQRTADDHDLDLEAPPQQTQKEPFPSLEIEVIIQAAQAVAEAMQGPNKTCQKMAQDLGVDVKVINFFHNSRAERYAFCEMANTTGKAKKKKKKKRKNKNEKVRSYSFYKHVRSESRTWCSDMKCLSQQCLTSCCVLPESL